MHQAVDWKKKRKDPLMHKHESMESPQLAWSSVPVAVSGNGDLDSACPAIFKIQGKSQLCAGLTDH